MATHSLNRFYGQLFHFWIMTLWREGLEEQLISMAEERPPLYAVVDKNYSNRIVNADIFGKAIVPVFVHCPDDYNNTCGNDVELG